MKKIAVIFLGAMLGSSVVWAQGTITDGAAVFTWNVFATNVDNCNFTIAAGPDHEFENWWYFRVDGDFDETAMPTPNTQDYTGNVATLGWADVFSRGLFDAELVSTVLEGGGGTTGLVRHSFTVTNISAAPLTINVFGYLDFDLTNTAPEDEASLFNDPDYMSVFDNITMAEYDGKGASEFQVTDTQSGAASLRSLFTDGLPTDLDGSGLPFGPADYEGAFQWTVTLGAADSATFTKREAIDQMVPVELISFDVRNE